ncbi:MAG: glycosyltransferase family 2 protein [Melioribacteraceae bacterium]|nr:glycosyltransferase family 2 protein [Melioribacteraceae bacterium]
MVASIKEIKVSCIIVNYNCFELLDICLKTLIKYHPGLDLEIIVVDNASTLGDPKLITDKYENVILIKNESNKGFAYANNQALNIASGEYTLILNNDIEFTGNVLIPLIEFLEKCESKCFVAPKLLNSDGSRQESVVEFPSVGNAITENFFLYKLFAKMKLFNKYFQNYIDVKKPFEVDVVKGAFLLSKTEDLKNLKGFDSRFFFYSEETDLCFRFKQEGGNVWFYPGQSVIHHGGVATNSMPWFTYKNQSIGKIKYYQKHFPGLNFVAVIIVHFTGLFLRGIIFSSIGIISFNKNILMKGYYFFKQMFYYPKNEFKAI